MATLSIASLPIAGCDLPPEPPAAVDHAGVIDTVPEEGARDVDRRPVLGVRFDRPILPRSISGEAVRLASGLRGIALDVRADPLLPGIVITPRGTLEPDVAWRLEIQGLRDLDGTVVAAHVLRFRTGSVASPLPAIDVPPWSEIGPLLAGACGGCHGGEAPLLGLDLATAEGVRATAIGAVALEIGPGPSAAGTSTGGGLGGMARIEPGSPETSYLVYKVLGDPHISGDRMPPPTDAGTGGLDAPSIAAIARWIAGGAPTE